MLFWLSVGGEGGRDSVGGVMRAVLSSLGEVRIEIEEIAPGRIADSLNSSAISFRSAL